MVIKLISIIKCIWEKLKVLTKNVYSFLMFLEENIPTKKM